MKRKLIIVILLVICLSFVGILICTRKNDDSVDVRNFKYGASPGNSIYGGACQGDEAFYFTEAFGFDGRIYKLSEDFEVEILNIEGGDVRFYDGYLYYVESENNTRKDLIRMNEETGEIYVIAREEDVVDSSNEHSSIHIMNIVNGTLYYIIRENDIFHLYSYNCNTGEIKQSQEIIVNTMDTQDFFRTSCLSVGNGCVEASVYPDWEFCPQGTSVRQYYGENIYTFEKLEERETEFIYEPKIFCIIPDDADLVNDEEYKNIVDTNVTAFNVSYEKVFYVRKEENENILTIYTVEHDGGNKQKITEIETDTEQWCTSLYVGDKYIVCQTSDWRENAEVEYINDRVYDTYIISIDGSNINKLEDVTQQ